jgi:hypothetical protein
MNWKQIATHIALGVGVLGIAIVVLIRVIAQMQEGFAGCQGPCQVVGPEFNPYEFLLLLAIIGTLTLIRIIIVDYLEPMLRKNGTD